MRATYAAHAAVASALHPGALAIDATAGNGHDTLFLCKEVGADGTVIAFDIQAGALATTRARLKAGGIPPSRFRLIHAGHEEMVGHAQARSVAAIMFNLGYLPGGDKTFTTRPETTLRALEAAKPLLRPGGVLTVVCYPGHEGGNEETIKVTHWAKTLETAWQVDIHEPEKAGGPFATVIRNEA